MKKRILLVLVLNFYFLLQPLNGQGKFRFISKNQFKQRVSFKLINNLIIIPIELNGKKLSFILDTGVNKSVLFNLSQNDSLALKNVKSVKLQGLGTGKSVDALISNKNRIRIKNIISNNETIYVLLKDFFELSSKMGTTIHGIIGYNILKDFIIKINYKSKKIDFYNPNKFKYKKCKKCDSFPISFYRRKPFINAKIQLDTIGNTLTNVKLLLDSGGSDAIWLFEHTSENILTPKKYFNDLLGEGLSGPIFGNRSRVSKVKLGKFNIINPTASFLDTISTKNARSFLKRNGSIGGDILKRFLVWIDYPNKKITLKKNGSLSKGFNYNMSGLNLAYNGKQLVKEKETIPYSDGYSNQSESNNTVAFVISYSYKFKPSYIIKNVLPNSPAFFAGLKKGDIIIKLNGRYSYDYTLNEIYRKFHEKDKKKIKMVIERNGIRMKFEFRLKKKV